jgi:hypothetical protein
VRTGFRAYDQGAVPEQVDNPCDKRALRSTSVISASPRSCRRASSRSATSRSRLLLDVEAHCDFLDVDVAAAAPSGADVEAGPQGAG